MAKRFVKLPIVVEAIQFNGADDAEVIRAWAGINPKTQQPWVAEIPLFDTETGTFQEVDNLAIQTLEGSMLAEIGDYVIKGVEGEFYPCKPDIFEKTYMEDL